MKKAAEAALLVLHSFFPESSCRYLIRFTTVWSKVLPVSIDLEFA